MDHSRTNLTSAALSLLALLVPTATEAGWSRTTRLTKTPIPEDRPALAVAGCTVHALWLDTSDYDLHYARSTDAGESWSDAAVLAASSGRPVFDAAVAAAGRKVHVVWQRGAYDQAQIVYRRSTDGGGTWRSPEVLSSEGESAEEPSLAVVSDDVYVVWVRTRGGSDTKPVKLVLARSLNGGGSWEPTRKVGRRALGLRAPLLATSADGLHLAWGHRERLGGDWYLEVLHRSSSKRGRNWTEPVQLTSGLSSRPWALAAGAGAIHVLFEQSWYKGAAVWYQRSTDAGATWSPEASLDEGSWASLAAVGDRLEAVWASSYLGSGAVIHRRSVDGGRRWTRSKLLSSWGRFPVIAASAAEDACGPATHVLFAKPRRRDVVNTDIVYRRHHRGIR